MQLYNRNSPDWVPSLHMCYPEAEDLESSSDAVGRYSRAAKRARTKSLSEPQSNSEVEDESIVNHVYIAEVALKLKRPGPCV